MKQRGLKLSAPAKSVSDGGQNSSLQLTPRTAEGNKVGRNDPCPCGAKKSDGTPIKYKHCHGK